MSVTDDGQLKILAQLSELKLPECSYFAVISPVENIDGRTSYATGIESINFIRSLIALAFGKLPFYTWVADFDFDTNGGVSDAGRHRTTAHVWRPLQNYGLGIDR
jgi:hypothetical protein